MLPAKRANPASASARVSSDICLVRSFIESADENSDMTQSLMAKSSDVCSLNHR